MRLSSFACPSRSKSAGTGDNDSSSLDRAEGELAPNEGDGDNSSSGKKEEVVAPAVVVVDILSWGL